MKIATILIAHFLILTGTSSSFSMSTPTESCSAASGAIRTPVIELYTSEGCSSCPPADKWLSTLKAAPSTAANPAPVVMAFHLGYWDHIGWVDRFASPAYTTRQRQIAVKNGQSGIYTPQAVLNGRDWKDWHRPSPLANASKNPAGASINLKQTGVDQFEALVVPVAGASSTWSAYWSVTEHGHSSKVKSGENAGEFLQHDFVVRQYTPVGDYSADPKSPQKLTWRSIAATPGHARQINLVVFDAKTGKTLQAVSAGC